MTIDEKMVTADNRPAGFDYLRLALAAAVIVIHGFDVTAGLKTSYALMESPWRILIVPVIPMFFGLSGFLVAASLRRCASLISFLGLRGLRIFPALAVEVLLCALLLGPLLTNVPLTTYFTSPELYRYFLNLVGVVQYVLPGVFTDNPWPNTVNAQLWTVPYELDCYLILAMLSVLGIVAKRANLLLVVIAAQVALAVFMLVKPDQLSHGRLAVLCFLVGILFHLYANVIPLTATLFWASVMAIVVMCAVPGPEFLIALPAVYATVYLGTLNPPRYRRLLSGDYSYGMYLYGFPLQQALMVLLPGLAWYENAAAGIILALGAAYLSWWFVEKPTQALKPALLRFEARYTGKMSREPAVKPA